MERYDKDGKDLVASVLEKTAHLWDEPVFIESGTGEDITHPIERNAYEKGLLAMREAMIPLMFAAIAETDDEQIPA